jgi:hypothetical protein
VNYPADHPLVVQKVLTEAFFGLVGQWYPLIFY